MTQQWTTEKQRMGQGCDAGDGAVSPLSVAPMGEPSQLLSSAELGFCLRLSRHHADQPFLASIPVWPQSQPTPQDNILALPHWQSTALAPPILAAQYQAATSGSEPSLWPHLGQQPPWQPA